MDIPHSYGEAQSRINTLAATLQAPGRMEAAEVIYHDVCAAVVSATRITLEAGGVGWNIGDTQRALSEAWAVFIGVWTQTSDLEQSMAEIDAYLDQDPEARALGGEFYLYGWQLERNKRLLQSLRTRPDNPAA